MSRLLSSLYEIFHRIRYTPAGSVYWCWTPRNKRTPMESIHLCASRNQFRFDSRFRRWLLKVGIFFAWPIRALEISYNSTREAGDAIRQKTGKSRGRQMLEQWNLAVTRCVPPRSYYQFELYDDEKWRQANEYLFNHEVLGLFHYLCTVSETSPVDDKMQFHDICQREGIATVRVLALFRNGESRLCSTNLPPETSLFAKPIRGARSEGAAYWQRTGPATFTNERGVELTWEELLSLLREKSRQNGYLLQPALDNHPDIQDLSNGHLASARIVTFRDCNGNVRFLTAIFKMPYGAQITSTPGLACAVDERTGTLGRGLCFDLACSGHDVHPDSSSKIAGRTLPHWGEAVALVRRAHRVIDECPFLGWDVAFTSQGPLILEPNWAWEVVTLQRAHGKPLGHTLFGELCLACINAVESGQNMHCRREK
jgi:hypothetical protein